MLPTEDEGGGGAVRSKSDICFDPHHSANLDIGRDLFSKIAEIIEQIYLDLC